MNEDLLWTLYGLRKQETFYIFARIPLGIRWVYLFIVGGRGGILGIAKTAYP